MLELIFAVAIAGGFVALTSHLVRRGRKLQQGREARLLDQPIRELGDMRAEDVLLYEARDYLVVEVWRMAAAGRSWLEAKVEDTSDRRWVVVREGDDGDVFWGKEIELPSLGAEPSEALDHGGEVYRLQLQGTAEREADEAQLRFWDYAQPGAPRLWIRQEGETRKAFAGERVARHLVEFLPGS